MSDAITRGPESQHNLAHVFQAFVRGWLAFEREDIDEARRWNRESLQLCERIGFPIGCIAIATVQVIFEASAGDAVAVRRAITELDACLGLRPTAFHALAGDLAKTYASLCRGERAEEGLRNVLVRGRQCGYGVFVGSRVVKRLVAAAFESGIEVEYARELQQAYELAPPQA